MQLLRKTGHLALCVVLVAAMTPVVPTAAAQAPTNRETTNREMHIRALDGSGELTMTPVVGGRDFRFRTAQGNLVGSFKNGRFSAGNFHLVVSLLEDNGDAKVLGLEVGYGERVEKGRVFVGQGDQVTEVTNIEGIGGLLRDVAKTPEGRGMRAAHSLIRRGVLAPVDECTEALFNAVAASIAFGATCAVEPEGPLCIAALAAYISTVLTVGRVCGCCFYDPNYNFYFP